MTSFFQTFTKIFGFLTAILFFIIILGFISNFLNTFDQSNFSYYKGNKDSDNKIAVLNISGPIISEPINISNFRIFNSIESIYPSLIEKYLDDLANQDILGLIVSLNSPGGSVSATQRIYKLFNRFKIENNIPLYFHTTDILASGGYWVSQSGDKIFANYGALIGSIGVKGPDWIYYNNPTLLSSGLLGSSVESSNGIKLFSNTAGISKDIFNPFRAPSKKEVAQLQKNVNDIYNDFVNLVSSNRKIEKMIIKEKIGAMIFNTHQAKENFLIDSKMDINESIAFLKQKLDLNTLKIIINKQNNKYKLFSLKFFSNLYKERLLNIHKNVIKNKFCNNLMYGFSAVAIKSYTNNC